MEDGRRYEPSNQESMFVAEAGCNHKGIFLKLQKTFIKLTTLKVFLLYVSLFDFPTHHTDRKKP